jgi:lipopolysaccharide O-acetyltransferase
MRFARVLHNIHRVLEELDGIFLLMPILYVPGKAGSLLRRAYYGRRLKHLGRNVFIDVGVQILNPRYISIGDNTWIDKFVILIAGEPLPGRATYHKQNRTYPGEPFEIHIGSNCHIAPFVIIQGHGGFWLGDNCTMASGCKAYTFSHHYRNLANREDPRRDYVFTSQADPGDQAMISGAVMVEDGAAVGLNSTLMPGVTVGKGSWIGSMSLVASDIPCGVVASGSPAAPRKTKSTQP